MLYCLQRLELSLRLEKLLFNDQEKTRLTERETGNKTIGSCLEFRHHAEFFVPWVPEVFRERHNKDSKRLRPEPETAQEKQSSS